MKSRKNKSVIAVIIMMLVFLFNYMCYATYIVNDDVEISYYDNGNMKYIITDEYTVYYYENGNMVIYGSGDMENYYEELPWQSSISSINRPVCHTSRQSSYA